MHKKISIHLVLTNHNKNKDMKSLFLNTLPCIHCLYIYIYIYIYKHVVIYEKET